eukprot:TCONS_00010526-protein
MPESEFSNPIAPLHHHQDHEEEEDIQKLTNNDFRSLLMTPRDNPKAPPPKRPGASKDFSEADDAHAKRRKKKLYYAKLKQQEEERQKELASKYRDRATERREGKNTDYAQTENSDLAKTAEYRAVAPTADQANNAAERRRLAIQESKFLGGDMEHTHLVKGLDFALLQKVRSEIAMIETEEDAVKDEKKPAKDKTEEKKPAPKAQKAQDVEFVSALGRKIHKAAMNTKPPLRNELFLPGRMAYVFTLDDEEESEIPTTTIRSKADCPTLEAETSLTTNDIVINKLTQILSYLRHGVRASKKQKKREKELIRAGKDPRAEESIYADLVEQSSGFGSFGSSSSKDQKKSKYFSDYNKSDHRHDRDREDSSRYDKKKTDVSQFVRNINEKYGSKNESSSSSSSSKKRSSSSKSKKTEVDSYAECYPGMAEMNDAVDDSDDDADYTKMDMGNKKGPVKRWDFENEDEYNSYMEKREAMPKAAFQFGIKMNEGRKTRSRPGAMSEKQKLDREWQQISNIISKRKSGDTSKSSGGKRSKDY